MRHVPARLEHVDAAPGRSLLPILYDSIRGEHGPSIWTFVATESDLAPSSHRAQVVGPHQEVDKQWRVKLQGWPTQRPHIYRCATTEAAKHRNAPCVSRLALRETSQKGARRCPPHAPPPDPAMMSSSFRARDATLVPLVKVGAQRLQLLLQVPKLLLVVVQDLRISVSMATTAATPPLSS